MQLIYCELLRFNWRIAERRMNFFSLVKQCVAAGKICICHPYIPSLGRWREEGDRPGEAACGCRKQLGNIHDMFRTSVVSFHLWVKQYFCHHHAWRVDLCNHQPLLMPARCYSTLHKGKLLIQHHRLRSKSHLLDFNLSSFPPWRQVIFSSSAFIERPCWTGWIEWIWN